MATASPARCITMWSGPRNISTALMRAWENRPDTRVVDEPFYAYYLKQTGKNHPGAEEIITTGQTDWRQVVEQCLDGLQETGGRAIFYQKQMTHHLLPEVDRSWLDRVTNCFLIRDPAEVITSYIKRNADPAVEDLGFVQQTKIFDFLMGTSRRDAGRPSGSERGRAASLPPVIDAKDVLQNPERMLRLLCDAVGVEFDKTMLTWPPGLRETDGVWAKHWYGEVIKSTGFQPYHPKNEPVPERLREVHERCQECYERLYQYRLH